MKRSLIVLAALFLLLGVFVQSSLAYSYVQGCVVDGKTNQPWTHGGTVTMDGGAFGSKTTTLDADGCFFSPLPTSVHGNPSTDVIVDLDPGPAGDPTPETLCVVPQDNTSGPDAIYDCGTMVASVGPNAVYLLQMNATGLSDTLFGSLALGLAGLAAILGLAVFWRRRYAQ